MLRTSRSSTARTESKTSEELSTFRLTELSAAVLWLTACAPSYETEQLKITLDESLPGRLCEGDLRYLQGEVDRIEQTLGLQMHRPADVVLYRQRTDCDSPQGCYDRRPHRVRATWASISHELVHAVARGRGPRKKNRAFFREGIAEAISDHTHFPRHLTWPSENLPISSSAGLDYETAGHFSRWLLEHHGSAGLRALLRGESFAAVYGESIEDAEQRWVAEAPWLYPHLDPCPYPPLLADADGWAEALPLDCSRDDVRAGGFVGLLETCRSFEIETPGLYWLASDLPGVLQRCQPTPVAEPPALGHDAVPASHNENGGLEGFAAGEREVLFEAGRHYLCVTQLGTFEPSEVSVSLQPVATTLVRP